jgi:hypothetical protein
MKIVIAGNYRQYQDYLRENKLSPREARYVSSPEHLRGLRGVEVVKYGEWWLNTCANDWCLELVTLPIMSAPNKRLHWTLRLWAWLKNLFGLGSRQ